MMTAGLQSIVTAAGLHSNLTATRLQTNMMAAGLQSIVTAARLQSNLTAAGLHRNMTVVGLHSNLTAAGLHSTGLSAHKPDNELMDGHHGKRQHHFRSEVPLSLVRRERSTAGVEQASPDHAVDGTRMREYRSSPGTTPITS
jgi:hypothetical protein